MTSGQVLGFPSTTEQEWEWPRDNEGLGLAKQSCLQSFMDIGENVIWLARSYVLVQKSTHVIPEHKL